MPYSAPTFRSLLNQGQPKPKDNRPSAAKRGYGRMHQRWRLMILARDPLCKRCEREGIVKASTDADHIVPLERGGGWSMENGQGLCHTHHSQKTALEDGGFGHAEKV